MKTSSAKNKGRTLQQLVVKKLLAAFPDLATRGVKSTSMGAQGVDVTLSAAAHAKFPFSIECKNQEITKALINMWQQTEENTEKDSDPLLVVHANHSPVLVVLHIDRFITLIKENEKN